MAHFAGAKSPAANFLLSSPLSSPAGTQRIQNSSFLGVSNVTASPRNFLTPTLTRKVYDVSHSSEKRSRSADRYIPNRLAMEQAAKSPFGKVTMKDLDEVSHGGNFEPEEARRALRFATVLKLEPPNRPLLKMAPQIEVTSPERERQWKKCIQDRTGIPFVSMKGDVLANFLEDSASITTWHPTNASLFAGVCGDHGNYVYISHVPKVEDIEYFGDGKLTFSSAEFCLLKGNMLFGHGSSGNILVVDLNASHSATVKIPTGTNHFKPRRYKLHPTNPNLIGWCEMNEDFISLCIGDMRQHGIKGDAIAKSASVEIKPKFSTPAQALSSFSPIQCMDLHDTMPLGLVACGNILHLWDYRMASSNGSENKSGSNGFDMLKPHSHRVELARFHPNSNHKIITCGSDFANKADGGTIGDRTRIKVDGGVNIFDINTWKMMSRCEFPSEANAFCTNAPHDEIIVGLSRLSEDRRKRKYNAAILSLETLQPIGLIDFVKTDESAGGDGVSTILQSPVSGTLAVANPRAVAFHYGEIETHQDKTTKNKGGFFRKFFPKEKRSVPSSTTSFSTHRALTADHSEEDSNQPPLFDPFYFNGHYTVPR